MSPIEYETGRISLRRCLRNRLQPSCPSFDGVQSPLFLLENDLCMGRKGLDDVYQNFVQSLHDAQEQVKIRSISSRK